MERLFLRKDKCKPILQKHPWIFAGAVQHRPANPQAEIVEISAGENQPVLAYGFYEHSAQLICKIFHFGVMPEEGFQTSYWKQKLTNARKCRETVMDFRQTDTWRLCHAEADGIPGLIADVYAGNCISFQTTCQATLSLLPMWIEVFHQLGYPFLFHRHGKEAKGKWIGQPPSLPLQCKENGLLFPADPATGQKTGFFIDQRDNRDIIRSLSKGHKVLNAFSYSGGFSVYAISGGASQVVSVDISKEACRLADAAVQLNFPEYKQHQSMAADCFDYLRQMPEDFDFIILDPPAFAKNRASTDQAARGYKEINLQAIRRIKAGGLLATFSCSQHISRELFQKILFAAALDSGRNLRILRFLHQPPDHPVSIFHPEGEYLKGVLAVVD